MSTLLREKVLISFDIGSPDEMSCLKQTSRFVVRRSPRRQVTEERLNRIIRARLRLIDYDSVCEGVAVENVGEFWGNLLLPLSRVNKKFY